MSNQLINKLKSYHAVGFDLDHTLAKYKIEALFPVILQALVKQLVEKFGWTKLLDKDMANYGPESRLWKIQRKGIVYDKKLGTLIQLNKNAQVVSGLKGRKTLSTEDIKEFYPDNKKPSFASEILEKYYNGRNHRVFENFFDIMCIPLLSEMVAINDQLEEKRKKSYSRIWEDLLATLHIVYDNTTSIVGHKGGFFDLIESEPSRFVELIPEEVKTLLRELREKHGVFVFLMTASNHEYATHLMRYIWSGKEDKSSTDEEWLKDFDLALYLAWKPDFFTRDIPFQTPDLISDVDELKRNGQYSKGNYSILQKFLQKQCNTEAPRVAYFGDSCKGDVYPLKYLTSWDSWSIVEELATEGEKKCANELNLAGGDSLESVFSLWNIPTYHPTASSNGAQNDLSNAAACKKGRFEMENNGHSDSKIDDGNVFESSFFCGDDDTLWFHNIKSCSSVMLQQIHDLV